MECNAVTTHCINGWGSYVCLGGSFRMLNMETVMLLLEVSGCTLEEIKGDEKFLAFANLCYTLGGMSQQAVAEELCPLRIASNSNPPCVELL